MENFSIFQKWLKSPALDFRVIGRKTQMVSKNVEKSLKIFYKNSIENLIFSIFLDNCS